jgi:hypothetical protein
VNGCLGAEVSSWYPVKIVVQLADGAVAEGTSKESQPPTPWSDTDPITDPVQLALCYEALSVPFGPLASNNPVLEQCSRTIEIFHLPVAMPPPGPKTVSISHAGTCVKPSEFVSMRAHYFGPGMACAGNACFDIQVMVEACAVKNTGLRPADIWVWERSNQPIKITKLPPGETASLIGGITDYCKLDVHLPMVAVFR